MHNIAFTYCLSEIFMDSSALYRLDTNMVHLSALTVVRSLGSFLCLVVGSCDVERVKEHVDYILKRPDSAMVSLYCLCSILIF